MCYLTANRKIPQHNSLIGLPVEKMDHRNPSARAPTIPIVTSPPMFETQPDELNLRSIMNQFFRQTKFPDPPSGTTKTVPTSPPNTKNPASQLRPTTNPASQLEQMIY